MMNELASMAWFSVYIMVGATITEKLLGNGFIISNMTVLLSACCVLFLKHKQRVSL